MNLFILSYLVLGIIALANSHKKLEKNHITMLIISLSVALLGSFASFRINNIDFVFILLLGALALGVISLVKSADKFQGSGKTLMIIGCSLFLVGILFRGNDYSSYSSNFNSRSSFEDIENNFEDLERNFNDLGERFEKKEVNYDSKRVDKTVNYIVKKLNNKSYASLWKNQEFSNFNSLQEFKENIDKYHSERGKIKDYSIIKSIYLAKNGREQLKIDVKLEYNSFYTSRLKLRLSLEEISNRYSVESIYFSW